MKREVTLTGQPNSTRWYYRTLDDVNGSLGQSFNSTADREAFWRGFFASGNPNQPGVYDGPRPDAPDATPDSEFWAALGGFFDGASTSLPVQAVSGVVSVAGAMFSSPPSGEFEGPDAYSNPIYRLVGKGLRSTLGDSVRPGANAAPAGKVMDGAGQAGLQAREFARPQVNGQPGQMNMVANPGGGGAGLPGPNALPPAVQ